jgi:hypothetical protein
MQRRTHKGYIEQKVDELVGRKEVNQKSGDEGE